MQTLTPSDNQLLEMIKSVSGQNPVFTFDPTGDTITIQVKAGHLEFNTIKALNDAVNGKVGNRLIDQHYESDTKCWVYILQCEASDSVDVYPTKNSPLKPKFRANNLQRVSRV